MACCGEIIGYKIYTPMAVHLTYADVRTLAVSHDHSPNVERFPSLYKSAVMICPL